MEPFTKKYAPKNLKEVVGQDTSIKLLKNFIGSFKKQKKKAVLLHGPSGTGKTASVYALANDLSLELLEVNASDYRNKDQINEKVGTALTQQSLFSKGKIVLVDEIDGLSGMKDRGGIQALIKLMEVGAFPLVFTSNNPWDIKFNKLRRNCELIEFKELDYEDVFTILKNICKHEKIKYEEDVLKGLARRTGGDCRAALNDLQTLTEQTKELTKESLEELTDRSKELSMPEALLRVFKTTDPKIAITAFNDVKEDLDQQLLWIDKNLPEEYDKPLDLARAYDKLSKADVFKRRIRRWQHWRFLVYINALITAGIAVSKDEKYKKYVQYKPTGRLLKLWWAKQKGMKKKAIAAKIASKTHSSTKEVLRDIEYFKIIFKKNKEMAKAIEEYADLVREEVEWLNK
jgi:replication factor C large subunit